VEQLATGEHSPYDFHRWMRKNPGQVEDGYEGPEMKIPVGCSGNICHAAMMSKIGQPVVYAHMDDNPETILTQAHDFFCQYFADDAGKVSERMLKVHKEVQESGTYCHSSDEIQFGARRAWRNAGRCIYRQVSDTLTLRDCRHVTTAKGMAEQLCQHIRQAWGSGSDNVPLMSIFPPKQPGRPIKMEFISPQPWRFAAYDDGQGGIVGDPANLQLTKYCVKLGWKPPPAEQRTEWDLLPVVVRTDADGVKMYPLPSDLADMIVHISHPEQEHRRAFQSLGLRWCGLPVLNTFTLWCGGVAYPCAPFSGWFMVTEVARNIADQQRYNKLSAIAAALQANEGDNFSDDMAWLELNKAIFHSWSTKGVPMVSHRGASEGFCLWYKKEMKETGACPGDWVWLVPPLGGSTLSVFHQEMLNYQQLPAYIPNPDHLASEDLSAIQVVAKPQQGFQMTRALKTLTVLVLVGSQTGNTELRAMTLSRRLMDLGACVTVLNMDEVLTLETAIVNAQQFDEAVASIKGGLEDTTHLDLARPVFDLLADAANTSTVVLLLTSTFGSGAPPQSASAFLPAAELLSQLAVKQSSIRVKGLRYAVCGFGSSNFPHFNRTGRVLQEAFAEVAGPPMVQAGECDEKVNVQGQFMEWMRNLMDILGVPGAGLQSMEEELPQWEWMGRFARRSQAPRNSRGSMHSIRASGFRGSVNIPSQSIALRGSVNIPSQSIGFRGSVISLLSEISEISEKSEISPLMVFHMEVLENTELISPNSSNRSMRHLVLRSEEGTSHRAGDCIEIIPENSPNVVEAFAASIGLDPSLLHLSFQLKYPPGREGNHSERTQLYSALSKDLDLGAPPTPELLRHLVRALSSARPTDPKLKQLQELQNGGPAYQKWVKLACPTVQSLFADVGAEVDFPLPKGRSAPEPGPPTDSSLVMLPAAALIGSLPAIRPRLYSISNGSLSLGANAEWPVASKDDVDAWCTECIGDPSSLHLTVSVNQIQGSQAEEAGPGACTEPRTGLASGFISRLQKGDLLRARVLAQPMNRLPAPEKLKELGCQAALLVGMGSGIAPLRAMLHELMIYRARHHIKLKVMLIHGCRTKEERVYLSEFQALGKLGVLDLIPAISRSTKRSEKGYAQDHVRQNRAKIVKMLTKQQALVYICGATVAVQSVRSTILEAVLCGAGRMKNDAAHFFLQKMLSDGLYHEEAFGGS
jgi:nitric oxide synthase oxygenase domain/subunit